MRYRLVIFDSDGTLADTLPAMHCILNELAEEHGFRRVDPGEMERFRALHGRALLQALGLPLWKVPRVVQGVRARMARQIHMFSLFQGVSGVLRRLAAAGITLGIVSSNSRDNIERILAPENAALIAHFAGGASMFGKAPKLRQVLRWSAIPREEAIYIGDEVRDAEAARKAGMAFGAVAWGHHSEGLLRAERPATFFRTVEEMATRLC